MHEEPTTPAPEGREVEPEERREGFGRQWQPQLYVRLLALGLIVAYAIAFVLENNRDVDVHFVLATARVSLIWLILLSVALGLLGGVLVSQLHRRRRRRH